MNSTIESARGRWPGIYRHFGVPEKVMNGKHQPCPLPGCPDGGGTDRFRFTDKSGDGWAICNKCGTYPGFKFLEKWTGKTFKEIADEVDKIVGNINPETKPKRDASKWMAWVSQNVKPVSQVPEVIGYLKGRGLKPCSGLRALEKARYYVDNEVIGEYAAMAAPFVSVAGKLIAWHLTYLKDGKKAPVQCPRKMISSVEDGGALRLTGVYPTIGIAEGIETALAVMADFRVPCWAAYCADSLEKFMPPKGVEEIGVYGDNDESFTGQKSAWHLGWKLKAKGYKAEVIIPAKVGDFASVRHG